MTIYGFNEAANTKVSAITGAALLGGSGGTINTIETNGNGQALSITPWTNNGLFKTGANRSDITLMTGYAGDITSFIAPVICCNASNEGYRAVLQNTSAGIFDRVQFSKDGTFLGVALFSTPLESANGAPRLDFRQSGADLLCDVYQGGSLYEALSYTDDTVEGPLTRTGTGILIAYQGSQLLLDSWNDNIAVVNIDPVLDTPISDISVGSDTSGVFASIAPNFSDANNDSLTYTVVPALPDGMELNSTTGEITGNGAITETAAADYVFYADDSQGGTPAQDTVSITVTAPVAVIDSTSAGPYYPGDTLLINHSNTSASGKLFAWSGISVSPTAEDANQSAIPIPNPLTAGFTTLTFGVDIDVTMDDAGEIATVQRQISVPVGYEIVTVASKNGFLAQAEFDSIQVGHELYCPIVTDADWANGAIPMTDSVQNYEIYVRNTADATPEWGTVPFAIEIPAAPVAVNNPATGQPTITGTPQVGVTLTADTSNVADADGLGTLNIQWLLDGSLINGATSATYVPVVGDVGSDVSVQVSFTDGEGNAEGPLTSTAVTIQAAPVSNTPTTGLPVITGTAQVGQQLGVDTSELADVDGLGSFTHSWRLDGSEVGTGATYTPNTTGSLLVVVSHTDGGGTVEAVSSAAVTVQAAPVVDSASPILSIQSAPASVSTTSAFSVTFEFNEDVTGFTASDIAVTNASVSNFVAVDGNTYTADITPDGNGNISISVAAGAAQDAAGNDSTAAQASTTFINNTPGPVMTQVLTPENLSLDVVGSPTNQVKLYTGFANRFDVALMVDGAAVDLSVFSRMRLIINETLEIDSASDSGIDWSIGNGVVRLDIGEYLSGPGAEDTTLLAYVSGIDRPFVLWHPQLEAKLRIIKVEL